MNEDCLKLTIYYGERDRAPHGFLADALTDIFARYELQSSLVMRGVEGFGAGHQVRTDRQLTLSEDLPLVSVAVDTRARIDAALEEVKQLRIDGLLTLERVRMLTGHVEPLELPPELREAIKLTVYIGRHERADGKLAYDGVVGLLHRRGFAGSTVLLGVDGTRHGVRHRARFFAANTDVPLMIIAVGGRQQIEQLLPELGALLPRPLITLERVRVCKREGNKLAEPRHLVESDIAGLGVWYKLMVYSDEQACSDGHPLHHHLIRALRHSGASGATTLRGIWGYHGDDRPHGDSFWQLRRRVPMITVIVDTPERTRKWFDVVDELTTRTGLVTSEIVPAFRASGPALTRGDLTLGHVRGDAEGDSAELA